MIYNMYSIFDRVTGQFGEPFLAVNEATAKRKFAFLMSNAKMVADDCQLFELAEFDNSTGDLVVCSKPVYLCNFQEVANV